MNVDIVRIAPQNSNSVYVQWDFTPNTGVVGNFDFLIERSGTPVGPWDVVVTLTNAVSYVDLFTALDSVTNEINLLSIQRSIYYRVTVKDPNGLQAVSLPVDLDGEIASDPAQQNAVPHKNLKKRTIYLRRKILRDETVAFKYLNGIELYVLKRKHFGERCTVCYDKLTRATTQSKCITCFGTSWTGGYYPAIPILGRLSVPTTQNAMANDGKSEIDASQLTLLNYPKVEEADVIVEKSTNRRWYIKAVMPTQLKRISVHQRISIIELPRNSVEYQIGENL